MGALVRVFTHGALSCVNKCEERERGTSEQIGESREVGVLKADRFSFPLQLRRKKKEKKGGGKRGRARRASNFLSVQPCGKTTNCRLLCVQLHVAGTPGT